MGGSTKQTTASATSKMSKLNSKLFKGKMVESMRKSTENLSGLLENNVTSSPTGDDPLAAGLELNRVESTIIQQKSFNTDMSDTLSFTLSMTNGHNNNFFLVRNALTIGYFREDNGILS